MLGIIRQREIWATHNQYLNDTREFLHAIQIVRQVLIGLRAAHGDKTVRDVLESAAKSLPATVLSNDEKRTALRLMFSVTNETGFGRTNVCVASFSEIRDSLSQWRAYAPHGGFCIGLRGERLADLVAQMGSTSPPVCTSGMSKSNSFARCWRKSSKRTLSGRGTQARTYPFCHPVGTFALTLIVMHLF